MDNEQPCRGPHNLQSMVTTVASFGIQQFNKIDRTGSFISFPIYRRETETQCGLNDLIVVEDQNLEWRGQNRVLQECP